MILFLLQIILPLSASLWLKSSTARKEAKALELELKKSLYDHSDSVFILNSFNIAKIMNNSSWPWMIEFYVHWCGHCKIVSKSIKQFALSTSNWEFHVGVLNCAVEHNERICKELDIKMYPTLKFYDAKTMYNEPIADFRDYHMPMITQNLIKSAADLIFNQTSIFYSTRSLSYLTPEKFNDFSSGASLARILILISGFNSTHAAKIITNDVYHCHKIKVLSVLSSMDLELLNVDIKDLSTLSSNPTVIFYKTPNENHVLKLNTSSDDIISDLRKFIGVHFLDLCPDLAVLSVSLKYEISLFNNSSPVFQPSNTEKQEQTSSDPEIYWNDLLFGIGYSLRKEVARRINFTEAEKSAILDWISLLSQCIPWPPMYKAFMSKFEKEMRGNSSEINVKNITGFMSRNESIKMFPKNITPVSCMGSDSFYRGFPCTMWLIFHVSTVTCESDNSPFYASKLLLTIRNYIDNFFGCAYCREHFLDMSAEVPTVVKNGEDATKWLWYSHNKVNARLFTDESSDPAYPKVQFPPRKICPDCYIDDEDISSYPNQYFLTNPGYGVGNVYWNWNVTHVYLRSHYGPGNIVVSPDHSSNSTINQYLMFENYNKRNRIHHRPSFNPNVVNKK